MSSDSDGVKSITGKSNEIEGVQPIPSISGLVVPVVGQYYKGEAAKRALRENPANRKVFLEFEPTNRYDPNAIKVLVVQKDTTGKFYARHVGYVQRHAAAKISQSVSNTYGKKFYLVGKLSEVVRRVGSVYEKDYEITIEGKIYNLLAFINQREKIANDSGIFGGPKKPGKFGELIYECSSYDPHGELVDEISGKIKSNWKRKNYFDDDEVDGLL